MAFDCFVIIARDSIPPLNLIRGWLVIEFDTNRKDNRSKRTRLGSDGDGSNDGDGGSGSGGGSDCGTDDGLIKLHPYCCPSTKDTLQCKITISVQQHRHRQCKATVYILGQMAFIQWSGVECGKRDRIKLTQPPLLYGLMRAHDGAFYFNCYQSVHVLWNNTMHKYGHLQANTCIFRFDNGFANGFGFGFGFGFRICALHSFSFQLYNSLFLEKTYCRWSCSRRCRYFMHRIDPNKFSHPENYSHFPVRFCSYISFKLKCHCHSRTCVSTRTVNRFTNIQFAYFNLQSINNCLNQAIHTTTTATHSGNNVGVAIIVVGSGKREIEQEQHLKPNWMDPNKIWKMCDTYI